MSLDRYETTGVIRDGELRLRHRPQFRLAMHGIGDGEVIVTIRKPHATRSSEMNRLYWAGYVAPLAEYTGYSPQWIHAYLKKRFLSPNHLVIADAHGEVVDEADLEPTTTTLNKLQFSEYLHQIEEWALELGVYVGSKSREYAHARS